MEFRKMVMITLYARLQKRHRCIEQCFGLCGRGRGWDDLGEWHWNMYNIIYEPNRQSRFDAGYRMLRAGALGWLRGMVPGRRREGGSGWGTWICHGYTHVPHPEPPSHVPPRTIPLGHPSAPALSILYPALNLDWQFVSHMILYMFQCHSHKSSHPLLSHRVQKSVYTSVSLAVSHTGLSLPSF